MISAYKISHIEHVLFWMIKSANFLCQSTDFVYIIVVIVYKWQINIHFSYLFWWLFYNI